jgi:mannosylglycerate hydrolase
MLPDEFLIGGETWIRNLKLGIRSARKYGAVMNVGYSPDAFGHITHLPAILRGFGINAVAIWRGVGREVDLSEFRWAAPDGSEVLVVHFPTFRGYGYMSEVPEDTEALKSTLADMRTDLEPYATTSNVLVPNGTDHLPAREGLSRIIRAANTLTNDAKFVHGTYPQFVAAVREELGDRYKDLPLVTGEFRSSSRTNILAGVLSTRMWLKQREAHCENLLARYAGPLSAWVYLLRRAGKDPMESDLALVAHAWKLLLQNGPHDSVTGCSVDAVYGDVGLRYDKVEQIAESLIGEYEREIARQSARPGGESVVVFNPENGPRTDFCTVRLVVRETGLPTHVTDGGDVDIPLQVVDRGIHSPLDKRERILAGFVAPDVPGFGYKSFKLEYGERVRAQHAAPLRDLESAEAAIENEFFHVAAESDGTITVDDKRSGRTVTGLNRFEDGSERGDEYTYSPPETDEIVSRPSGPVTIEVTESGPARWTLEVWQTYSLPSKISADRTSRSNDRVDCEIVSRIRLYPGVVRIDIETEVDNQAEDHRLRVFFPSGVVSEYSHAEQHFGVVKRRTASVEYDDTWYERPVNTHAQKTFTDLGDGTNGLDDREPRSSRVRGTHGI